MAITLCELCMPEAFCGLETVRLKPPWPPCALWEKKLPSMRERCDKNRWANLSVMIWVILNTYEKHLQNTTRSPFIYDGNISKMQEYNHHVLRELWTRIENMPFLPQEGRLQRARRACSRMMKGVLLFQARPFLEKRGAWQLKYIDNSCLNV